MFGFGILLTVALFKTRSEAQPGSFTEVTKGIWFREGNLMLGHCNNTVIEMKDYLVVIDANYPSGARAVMEDIKKVSSKPVKYVFDTHHHGDHAYGNAVWTKAGATTLAYQGVAEEMKRYEPARWRAEKRPDVNELNLSTAEPPQQTFNQNPFVLKDETRKIEFHFFGWAHTRGDGFAWLPTEKVLATGDAATNGPYNYVADANLGNWPKVMAAARKLDPQLVLPGHGPRGGVEILKGQQLFFEETLKAVGAEIKKGKKLEDVVTFDGKKAQLTTIRIAEGARKWVGNDFPGQVATFYKELSQKTPAGDLPHN